MRKILSSLFLVVSLLLPVTLKAAITAIDLRIDGFYCDYCGMATVRAIRGISSVASANLWLKNGIIHVTLLPSARFRPQEFIEVVGKSNYVYRSMSITVSGTLTNENNRLILSDPDNNSIFILENLDNLPQKQVDALYAAAGSGKQVQVEGMYISDNDQNILELKNTQL